MSSHIVDQLCHENPPNKCVSLNPWYNQSLLLLVKLERNLEGFEIF
jgi:hypothetical protein